MLVEKIKCLQNSNKDAGAKERGKGSDWKKCSASRVLVYSIVLWHEALMDGAMVNRWGAGAPGLGNLASRY